MVGSSGGGGGTAYAYISVTYPAGSVCTCVSGGTTLTAPDTSGAFVFEVPSSGSWVITATDGVDTATKTVTITSQYQIEFVGVSYRVPAEYQEVEYLEGKGAQYIELPTTSDLIKSGSAKFNMVTNVNYSALFGSSNSTTSSTSAAYGLIIGAGGSPSKGFQYNGARNTNVACSVGTEYTLTWATDAGSQTYVLNGTTYTSTTSGYPAAISPYLFTFHYKTTIKSSEIAKVKVYSLTFYGANGDPIIECVPCYRKADSVAGMWERVTETFLTNLGSGSFDVGGDVN